jgi:transposase
MIRPINEIRVHLCRDVVDFRKQIRGLSVLVQEELELDPFCAQLFGFCNRRRDHIKLLLWERNGFVLWQKKLDVDRFPWPRDGEDKVLEVTGREMNWLLDGMNIFAMQPHGSISYDCVL